MKKACCVSIVVLIFAASCSRDDPSCSNAGPLSSREKSLLKAIIAHSFKMRRMSIRQNPDNPKQTIENHPFSIARSAAKDKERQLVRAFNRVPEREKLLVAQALAYLGNDTGVDVLKEAAFGMGIYTTNSGFEISESAICLLYLGYDFPDDFKFSKVANPLYPFLDIFLDRQ
ncbi:MAG: hypothetical protein GY854_27390 [Deltaproteobacteria bacterium]|nr:hypothetical protein [Deltaproteobacteria bacterium]